MSNCTVRAADWPAEESLIRAIRRKVFIEEQHVSEEEEWDGRDAQCRHVLALSGTGAVIGTGRVMPDGKIGRVAVLAEWRGQGVGEALMHELIRMARDSGLDECYLHAQTYALPFYEKLGFVAEGGEFMDANIPHRAMRLRFDA